MYMVLDLYEAKTIRNFILLIRQTTMKNQCIFKYLISSALIVFAGGCAIVPPEVKDFDPDNEVVAIETPHTSVLSCLGDMIDKGSHSPVFLNVHKMRDETVPDDFRVRGLTGGGMWLATTAITRLNTKKVVAVLARYSDPKRLPGNVTKVDFRGAFTQYDRLGLSSDESVRAAFGKFGFNLGGSKTYELVTGDFTTSINGRVLNATAIGIIVLNNSRNGALFWNDGDESVSVSLRGRVREGRQNAQRHIIEAATVLHVASYFDLDYKKCFQNDDRYELSFGNDEVANKAKDSRSTHGRSTQGRTPQNPYSVSQQSLIKDLCRQGCAEYVVQPGDQLSDIIARNYQDPYQDVLPMIFAANPSLTDPDKIDAGLKLTLPQVQ